MLNIKNIIKIFSEYNRQYLWENCLPKNASTHAINQILNSFDIFSEANVVHNICYLYICISWLKDKGM